MGPPTQAKPTPRLDVEAELRLRNWELAERAKELACLHGISRLRENPDLPLETFLAEAVQLIPRAWQFPSLAVARIRVHDQIYATGPFPAGLVTQSSVIKDGERVIGEVEVGYRPERPVTPEAPFLVEEGHLIDSIAERLGAAVAQSQAANQIRRYQAQLRSLASELALTSERERRHIAKELHDQVGQNLAAIKFRLNRLRTQLPAGGLDEVLALVEQTIDSSRTLTFELSPPVLHELGLEAALEWLVHQLRANFSIAGQFVGDRNPKPLSEDERIALFQAVRELLNNVGKHSRASMARVEAAVRGGDLVITVSDDGTGFDPAVECAPNHGTNAMGLFSVRERLAYLGIRMVIDTRPGAGTRIMLYAPLHRVPEAGADAGTRPGMPPPALPARRTRVLLVEDQTLSREGMKALLQQYPDMEVAGEARDGEEAVAACREIKPDVVVMDIAMPRMNGIEATRRLLEERPLTKVVALSMHADSQYVLEMLRAGASGYLLKDCAQEDLAQAIRVVQAHFCFLSPGLATQVAEEIGAAPATARSRPPLSPRELHVLKLLVRGLATKEIAADLAISPKTVETYRKHLMEKLGIDSIAGLTRFAIREGLVQLQE